MNELRSGPGQLETHAFSQTSVRAILSWLSAPPPSDPLDQLMPLHRHLAALRASQIPSEERAALLDRLFRRTDDVVSTLVPTLSVASLPIPRKTRQLVRSLQDLLRAVAEDMLATLPTDTARANGLAAAHALTLWRSLYALSLHLLISNLAASPAGIGVWRLLHQCYDIAHKTGAGDINPAQADSTVRDLYLATVLLGCAQPASFTSGEIKFVAVYLELFAKQIDMTPPESPGLPAFFWIDPERDAPAVACVRKPPPPETQVRHISCTRLVAQMHSHLTALQSGTAPRTLGLPDFAGTPAGQGVLRRLIGHWGEPGKRRFQRRRQHYRAALFTGLDNLWRVFQGIGEEHVDTSTWMVTNESPDGYSVMHVSGRTGTVIVGDITAIRIESQENWQICIVRWALSENQEHLELGLQILATNAIPAFVALPEPNQPANRVSVLILPEVPPLRANEMLVTPSGALDEHPGNFVLVIEKEQLEMREVRHVSHDEQNSQIDVFSIAPGRKNA